jgi:hypothetical protein
MNNIRLENTVEFQRFSVGTERFYKYSHGTLLTDGTKYLAQEYQCYWFIDLVAIYSKDISEEFQVWILKKTDGKFTVTVEDGRKRVVKTIPIPFSDFKADEVRVWFENNVIMIPCER